MKSAPDTKLVATNRKAHFDYYLEDKFEAGLALTGTEIKSVRAGGVQLRDGYVAEQKGELWLLNVHIAPYKMSQNNHEALRPRKLLLHKREIKKLAVKLRASGYTIVPLSMYLRGGHAKAELVVARGKQQHDKRQAIAKRESDLAIRRELGRRR
ncbi:MAG: SsrA-binding protein SmpB [Chloroflexi bacterium]|nr:SsrA-binding protein SmpB [Chloroflexota bacterium]MQC24909.1 SsrA-binding protein SmpB [Chloroflexota bacterium]RLT46699.1 MAG: SsrA-binding protein SmpB [Chloroflexota bacterium]